MPTKTIELEHGIIFVYDITIQDLVIPEYLSGVPISSNEQCISIIGLSYIDGQTTITIDDKMIQPLKHLAFEGKVSCPSKRLSVCVAADEEVICIETATTEPLLRVWLSDLKFPDNILIEAR